MPETPKREGQKRQRELVSPSNRHHSADSPLAKRTQPNTDDVVFWMPMSPQGTLRNAIRHRTPSAPANATGPADTSSIVQRILDGRQSHEASPSKGDKQKRDELADGDLFLSSSYDAAEATPVARRTRAVPRPLVLSKSEKVFDKRQLLSSLLWADVEAKENAVGLENSGAQPLRVCKPDESTNETGGSDDSPTLHICQPDDSAKHALAEGMGDDDDLCLDDIDMDGLMDGLDDFDDLMQGLDDGLDGLDKDIDGLDDGLDGLDDGIDGLDTTIRVHSGQEIDTTPSQRFRDYEKCLTLLVTEGWYTGTNPHAEGGAAGARPQKVVRVYSQTAVRERILLLRSEWYNTPIAIGNYVNIVGVLAGNMTGAGEVVIDSQSSSILPILHPDIMVSCTHLSDSFSCVRRAVLRDRMREIPEGNAPSTVMLVGSLLHDLFQSCALQNRWDDATMTATIRRLVGLNVERLWESGMDEESAFRQAEEIVPVYQQWARTYMHWRPQEDAQYAEHGSGSTAAGAVAVAQILNMEENVWSPKFGLKGKVDLTVLAQYAQAGLVEPFELKTGRRTDNAGHRAQVMMYTLLLADRYGVDVGAGLLYYPRTGEVVRVPRLDAELRALVAMRNTMTQHLSQASESTQSALPEMLGNEFWCTRCSYQAPCFIMHRALEGGSAKTARVSDDAWDAQTAHLSDAHLQFVRVWMALIDSEEADMLRFRAELWTMAAAYREQQTGRCLAGMRLDVGSVVDTGEVGSFSRYRMTFMADGDGERRSMLDSQLAAGDPVVVSSEPNQYALAVGYVVALEHGHVTVSLDRPVRGVPKRVQGFDRAGAQRFEPILEIRRQGGGEATTVHTEVPASAGSDVFRIDKDEMNSAMSRVRANMMRLFVSSGSARYRRLVVDLDTPTFSPLHPSVEARVHAAQREQQLNSGQALVLRRVLAADDYALVMGMPGTGKTTTIAALVGVLTALGKSVLLASYTHSAVDNVLLKLLGSGIPMVRLGNRNKVHPRVAELLPSSDLKTVRELDAFFRGAQVVATTCLGVTHAVFSLRRFDYCIVDEASQITLPVCLGPLLEAHKFVLVGDHHQLPPLVRNAGARDAGLGTSLFKRLCDAHPGAVVRLEFQYRMNAAIQRLANCLIYDGHLRCASLQVARRRIVYSTEPSVAAVESAHRFAWAVQALDAQRGAVFVDTDAIQARENRLDGSDSAQNDAEIRVIRVLTSLLQACGVEGRNVGILSPYRAQLRQLEIEYGIRLETGDVVPSTQPASMSSDRAYSGIEMHTIDRYQGRDAEVIIISWVRSNSGQAIGELLRDWHRINVAITRARNKLIMVGSRSTLMRSPLLAGMLNILASDNCVVKIPADADVPDLGKPGVREEVKTRVPAKPTLAGK
ncbi:DNA replication endonuclease-helicase Dna2 [Coemansia sp. RSA 2618]|nr:DNA replication endonuclease-helicase Dna2 [Coemansia sp. RSA 2618]